MVKEAAILSRFLAVRDHLDELGLRMFAAGEARAVGPSYDTGHRFYAVPHTP